MEEKLDMGIVTQNGIWFRGNIYSCSLAIHEKWFERAREIGGWPVAVKSCDTEGQMQVILDHETTVKCFQIEIFSRDSREFQKLIGLRKELLERKMNDEDRFSDKHLR